ALRGTARSARCDGRRGGPGGLLADDQGDHQMTTTAMSLSPSLPSSFQLASDEVHSWCASLDVPPERSARLYATLTPDERTQNAFQSSAQCVTPMFTPTFNCMFSVNS